MTEQTNEAKKREKRFSRRDFIKTASTAAAAATLVSPNFVHPAGSEELKIGLIGCGGRGTSAVTQALQATDTPVKLWAMGDVFRDHIDSNYKMLSEGAKGRYDRDPFPPLSKQMDVPEERKFVGFDAYKKVLATDVDIVILACPPGMRPLHFEAAVKAGKHVFMEKPVAVDPVGIRKIIASAAESKKKGLAVVAGTQRRHQGHYLEVMKRVHDGAIGEIVAGQCCWNSGGFLNFGEKPEPGCSEMEAQLRRWYYYVWICGDHIVEQHVHNLDVMNWAIGSTPTKAMGIGGRLVRKGKEYGNIYDHFTIEYEYPNGARVLSTCRHMDGCSNRNAERVVGTTGVSNTNGSAGSIEGKNPYKFDGKAINPYVQEHADLINSIRNGTPLNEGKQVAESTLTAIMGRMSAYTGRAISWKWVLNASKLDYTPPAYDWADVPVHPVSVPGKTPLI